MSALIEVFGFILFFLGIVYVVFGGATKIGNKITQKATSAGWGIVLFFLSAGSILVSMYGITVNLGYKWSFIEFLERTAQDLYDFSLYLFKYIRRFFHFL